MDPLHQGVVALLKAAITGEAAQLPEEFDIEKAYPLLRSHGATAMGYAGGLKCGISKSCPAMQKLRLDYFSAMAKSQGQMDAVAELSRVFNANGIDHMPLKGCNMKARYPKPELRTMGDADILIRMEQYERIVPILEGLGFSFKCESDHEIIWQSAGLYLELHKRLVPSYQKDLSPYFEDCWDRASAAEGRRYVMTPEDEWLYLFTHFAKHFRDSGIGCRHVADLWVFLRTCPGLNEEYVNRVLGELKLLEFYENIRHLLRVWFEGAPSDSMSEVLAEYIFASGSWGDADSGVLSGILRNSAPKNTGNARYLYLRKYAFPDLETMQRRHKILKKLPWLLPVMWIIRLGYKLLLDRKELKRKERALSVITEENIRKRREILHYVGLDFHG